MAFNLVIVSFNRDVRVAGGIELVAQVRGDTAMQWNVAVGVGLTGDPCQPTETPNKTNCIKNLQRTGSLAISTTIQHCCT